MRREWQTGLALGLVSLLATSCPDRPSVESTSAPSDKSLTAVEEDPAGGAGRVTGVERVFPSLTFERPTDLAAAGDGSKRLFILEQPGRIRVIHPDAAVTAATFLDLTDRVNSAGKEEGLLGIAFHPQFATNHFFYVNYTAANPRRTVIARFTASSSQPDRAEASSEKIILTFNQPYENHNGGQLAFGPDGTLYIATGDGGSGGDPHGNGQNRKVLLGKLLRIDVDKPSGKLAYGVPADNPYATNPNGYRPEIFCYGLRNPWRFSFDPDTQRIYAGDVGQDAIEEVDVLEKGKNYGWNIMEGNDCFNIKNCSRDGLTLPIATYGRDLGVSVTGGQVYRGKRLPGLVGAYVYADFGTGNVWKLRYDGAKATDRALLLKTGLNISSFGIDEDHELYFVAFDGHVYRFK